MISALGAANRYDPLADFSASGSSPKRSKKRPKPMQQNEFIYGEETSFNDDQKYIIVKSANENKSFSTVCPFVIHKSLQSISTKFTEVKLLRNGTLLVLCKDRTVANLFTKQKHFCGLDVVIELHSRLNASKGVIFHPLLRNCKEEDILNGLREKNKTVVEAKHITKQIENTKVKTGAILITFDTFTPPEKIICFWEVLEVRRWFPSPRRCRKCQRLGHTSNFCSNLPNCEFCSNALEENKQHNCNLKRCINCKTEGHAPSDRDCPSFAQAKEILKIKTIRHCAYKAAVLEYNKRYPNGLPPAKITPTTSKPFANMVNNNSKNLEKANNVTKNITPIASVQQPSEKKNTTIDKQDHTSTEQQPKVPEISAKNAQHNDKLATKSNEIHSYPNIHHLDDFLARAPPVPISDSEENMEVEQYNMNHHKKPSAQKLIKQKNK